MNTRSEMIFYMNNTILRGVTMCISVGEML